MVKTFKWENCVLGLSGIFEPNKQIDTKLKHQFERYLLTFFFGISVYYIRLVPQVIKSSLKVPKNHDFDLTFFIFFI